MSYRAFLESKRLSAPPVGFDVSTNTLNSALFPFQRDIVQWACRRGRAAIFSDCGTGKTPMQLEWARLVCEHTGGSVLILAPLAVSLQTQREGMKFGITVTVCKTAADLQPGINITNYERLHHFSPEPFAGIVLDESSILKGFDGVFRKQVTEFARALHFRLACTATPAPNDLIEITNHAEFLDVMTGKEIIALFFRQDGNTTHAWRLKNHARQDFWRWLASWSVALRHPSDLGYDDGAFILPELIIEQHTVQSHAPRTTLFAMDAQGLSERLQARRDSLSERVVAAAELVNASADQWIVWCNLNAESTALAKAIPDAVEITGSDENEKKERAAIDFVEKRIRVMVSKPLIFGHGMNWQNCHRMAFVGLSDSYEQLYQAVRRCWRFGQTEPVRVAMITADTEGGVVRNIERKEKQANEMMNQLVRHMAGLSLGRTERQEMDYHREKIIGGKQQYTIYLGDAVEVMDEIETESVGLSVFSPPFPGMYAYTNSSRDMGNVKSIGEMIEHFAFLVAPDKLLRVTMPGRSCCVHLTQAVAFKGTDGYIGLKDFRGAVIRTMEEAGWIYYGEVCIEKDPQVKAIRTKDAGLLFKSLATDSSRMHMALADYLLQFRKPGDNPAPIHAGISERYSNPDGWITSEEWIEWAAPVWYRKRPSLPGGISETDVLNVAVARDNDDQKHLCPLQLGVIERAVKLWSNPGEIVLSPFMGVGSEGYKAVQLNRRFIGIELKASYFRTAAKYLEHALAHRQQDLFDLPVAAPVAPQAEA